MARVTGPLMSFDASGSVAGSVVFSKWRGRNYVRRHAVPANPRSAAQLAARSIVAFLGQQWATIGDDDQATWEALGEAAKYSPFNAYVANNARNWRDLLPPSQAYPAARIVTPSNVNACTATVSGRQIQLAGTVASANDTWAVAIGRALVTGGADSISAVVAIVALSGTDWAFTDGPLAPDQYFYQAASIGPDGVLGAWFTEVDGTVS